MNKQVNIISDKGISLNKSIGVNSMKKQKEKKIKVIYTSTNEKTLQEALKNIAIIKSGSHV